MLGLGETEDEIYQTMDDLLAAGVRVMTIGQYLRPTADHMPVHEYIRPENLNFTMRWGSKKALPSWKAARWCVPPIMQKNIFCDNPSNYFVPYAKQKALFSFTHCEWNDLSSSFPATGRFGCL